MNILALLNEMPSHWSESERMDYPEQALDLFAAFLRYQATKNSNQALHLTLQETV